ncbi:Protein fmp32, mitochondrial [Rhizina undulata]
MLPRTLGLGISLRPVLRASSATTPTTTKLLARSLSTKVPRLGAAAGRNVWVCDRRIEGRIERRADAWAHRRAFHASVRSGKDHHFDTLKFVQRLQAEGFSEEQAMALMRILNDVIEESIQNLTRTMVLKEDQEKITYTQKVDFSKLRSELTTLHAHELGPILADQERLSSEITRLNSRLREEIQRAQSSVRLDLNLEKGRIREESSVNELKIKETDTRIEKEVGDLRGFLESVKFSTLQWLIGVCTGTAALLLGVWRLLM